MEPQERNVALEIVRGAFAALSVPVSWAAGLPRAAALLLHRARSSEERSAPAGRRPPATRGAIVRGTPRLRGAREIRYRKLEPRGPEAPRMAALRGAVRS